MGVVYEAEQESLRRRVAIKVLPGHLMADERLRARFRREAQAAAEQVAPARECVNELHGSVSV